MMIMMTFFPLMIALVLSGHPKSWTMARTVESSYIKSDYHQGNQSQSSLEIKALLNLGTMAAFHTGCEFPYFPIPYGCWCGITTPFPAPHDPIDRIDASCKVHDFCYEEAIRTQNCSILDAYIWVYKWDYVEGQIVCMEDNLLCQRAMCECDKEVINAVAILIDETGDCPQSDPGCPEAAQSEEGHDSRLIRHLYG